MKLYRLLWMAAACVSLAFFGSTLAFATSPSVLLGAVALGLVILLLVTSPYALGAYRRCWVSRLPTASAGQMDALVCAFGYASPEYIPFQSSSGECDQLTDEKLCRRWTASYSELQQEASVVKKIAIVAERQLYLDEFERRNASGLAAWLASGPRASGDPLPYLSRSGLSQSTINWDELTTGPDGSFD
jgi:hypothetical protein